MKMQWLLAGMMAATINTAALAQNAPPGEAQTSVIARPKGDQIVCNVSGTGIIVIRLADGSSLESEASASGTTTLESQGEYLTDIERVRIAAGDLDAADVPAGTLLTLQELSITGTDANYGDYSFSLDVDRPAANSTLKANQAHEDFPATADIYANVTGTISGLPGTFTNNTQCHMRATNLTTFAPQVNEAYEFVEDVEFSNEDGTTFTIPAGATITLN